MDLSGKKVVLIDGSGYIFRAFYALPPMTRPSDKTPVNAVYGFCSMMMKLIKDMPADYIAVVFDAARKTFRQDIYENYKANRRETPEDLIPQFPLLRQAVSAFNLAQVEMEGFEADDLLATYSRLAHEQGAEVTVISADKDLMQLVGGNVTLFDPMKQRVVDDAVVFEKFGVSPDKVVDVQALAGDTSDNVPGVPGIGPKTASQLVSEYGSVENILKEAPNFKPSKRKEMLIQNADLALISKKLVQLDAFAPVDEDLKSFAFKPADSNVLGAFFADMGFKSLVAKVPNWVASEKKEAHEFKAEYNLIKTKAALTDFAIAAEQAGVLSIATITDNQSPMRAKLIGLSVAYEAGKAFYLPLNHVGESVQASLFETNDTAAAIEQVSIKDAALVLSRLFNNAGILKIGHNIKSDWHVITNSFGSEVDLTPLDDVAVMAYDLDGLTHGLELGKLSEQFLDHSLMTADDLCKQGRSKIGFDRVKPEDGYKYAAEKSDIILRLHKVLKQRLIDEKSVSLYEKSDRAAIPVLYEMEHAGIKVDAAELKKLSGLFGAKMAEIEQQIYQLAGEEFNVNSPAQSGVILFEKLNIANGKKSKSGAWITDASVLEEIDHPVAAKILEYRQFSKLKSTYTDALQAQINPKTGRVHTTFLQTGTLTGRLSSNDPNLQNIPIRSEEGREIRKAFVADKGNVLISADYSQIELRLMADVADVKKLKEAFAQNIDIHAATASHVFNVPVEGMDPMVRRSAKAINFGIIYGISAFGLARQLGISRGEAQKYITAYFEKYPEIKTYMEKTVAFARENGFVMTPFGRKCFTSSINDKNPAIRQFAERSAINAPIQGGAADILKRAMIRLPQAMKEAGLTGRILLQVHDELVLEVPEDQAQATAQKIKDVMENVFNLSVPLIAEVGIAPDWAEAH